MRALRRVLRGRLRAMRRFRAVRRGIYYRGSGSLLRLCERCGFGRDLCAGLRSGGGLRRLHGKGDLDVWGKENCAKALTFCSFIGMFEPAKTAACSAGRAGKEALSSPKRESVCPSTGKPSLLKSAAAATLARLAGIFISISVISSKGT